MHENHVHCDTKFTLKQSQVNKNIPCAYKPSPADANIIPPSVRLLCPYFGYACPGKENMEGATVWAV